ncbi:ribosome small subunit-dependent GTPase A [Natranaerobius trueperi]|uniref:Small ribosomal subunit biogenesis GTPase RsgA n=1 Tax=Natranaerobius trueperi TaxID=759412 RepID=A0A226BZ19_9FIRM|nr:ribosome small subunit-dependent GTPase A [Natranaerobius trueperi]OWZ84171.1 ribosome small subunit-dependent GTPase A [Natranaerobius trueperi]
MRGRVIKIINDFYYVKAMDNNPQFECKLKGTLLKERCYPLVGDVVELKITDYENSQGQITSICPRKNRLIRPAVSNVDQVIIVTSPKEPNPNLQLIDRILVWAYFEGLKGIICINKKDLDLEKTDELVSKYTKAGYDTVKTSAANNKLGDLEYILKDKVTVLAGQSGVGKSSLLNTINPEFNLRVEEVSKKAGTGKHTTRHCQLFEVKDGYLVDTPGFNKKKLPDISPYELIHAFPDIKAYAINCKFNDCSHRKEPGCQVRPQVGGNISKSRLDSFVNLFEELVEQERRF